MQLRALIVMVVVGCVPPQPANPGYYPNNNGGYNNNQGYTNQGDPEQGYAPAQGNEDADEDATERPPPPSTAPAKASPQAAPRRRNIQINGAALDERTGATLAQLEAIGGVTLDDGKYWYDSVSGVFGNWGQPPNAWIGAGHALGPRVPANASGGTSGVYINGRQLQVREVEGLSKLVAYPWQRGRYFIDATGNAGVEGGPVIVNILVRAQEVWGPKLPQGGGRNADGTISYTIGSGLSQGQFFSDGKCRHYQNKDGTVISSGC